MHSHSITRWTHGHSFLGEHHSRRDLHVWQLGPGHSAVIASVVSDMPQAPAVYKQRLDGVAGLSHVTVEVNACSH
jgi:Co/Zn/Cd efflux system component